MSGRHYLLLNRTCNASVFQLAHESAGVVEVAVARVGIHENRDVGRGVAHELERVEHLSPRRLVAIPHPELR